MSQDLFSCPLGSLFKKEIDEEDPAALPGERPLSAVLFFIQAPFPVDD